MLQAIRSRAGSFVVKALFGLLILTFGIWGIGDIFRNRPTDTTMATVGSESIDAAALQTALQPALERLSMQLGAQVDLRQAKQMGIVQQVLAQLIDNSIIDQEAKGMQLDVSDAVIRDMITRDPMFRGAGGGFDRNAFEALLAANHMTEAQYVERVRHNIARDDLLLSLTAGVSAPQAIVDRLYRYRNEKRVADIVALPVSSAVNVGQPSDAELKKFYDAHPDMFRAPEYRGFTMASLTPADLAAKIEIPEAKLKSAYDQRQDEFVLPERRDVQQILAPSEEKAKAVEAALAAGKDWTTVAQTIAGQAPQSIDLGLVKREDLPKQLADAAFSLPLDKPSAPIKSTLGWHILQVVKIVPPTTQSFAEVKAKLQADLAHSEAADRLYDIGNHVDDAIAGGATLDEAAAKFGLKKTVINSVDEKGQGRDGKQVQLPVSPADVLKLAFATDEGRTTRVTQTSDGAIYVLHMDKIVPPSVRPLSEVKDKAVAAWQAEQRKDKVAKEAEALAAAVKPGMQLSTMAAAQGLKATTSPPFQRQPDNATGVPPALVDKLFAAKPGGVVTASDATGSYVAQLIKVEKPKTTSKDATADLTREVTAGMQADLGDEFTRALHARFPVEIHRENLDRLF
jgi:peptidyl-prolyl cis-trans isomerase D